MVPLDDLWVHDVDIDWKNLVENYVEDYHFPMGHPGLSALMESNYDREAFPGGTMRLSHHMREKPLRSWSAERYAKFLPTIEHLPESMRRRLTYLGLFPSVFFDIYPEWLDFFQLIPLGAGRTRIRARSYGFPDDRREMKAARWLCAIKCACSQKTKCLRNRCKEDCRPGRIAAAFSRTRISCWQGFRTGFVRGCRSRGSSRRRHAVLSRYGTPHCRVSGSDSVAWACHA